MSSDLLTRQRVLEQIFRSDFQWLTKTLKKYTQQGLLDAEDIASESFLRLAALPELLNVREPRAMLTTFAKRVVYDSWRRRDLERAYLVSLCHVEDNFYTSPEKREMVLESLLAVDKILDGLSMNARRAFLLNQLDGLTYAAIAEELGVSTGMVRKYIAQALAKCYAATAD